MGKKRPKLHPERPDEVDTDELALNLWRRGLLSSGALNRTLTNWTDSSANPRDESR